MKLAVKAAVDFPRLVEVLVVDLSRDVTSHMVTSGKLLTDNTVLGQNSPQELNHFSKDW